MGAGNIDTLGRLLVSGSEPVTSRPLPTGVVS
jgi:hypothetical protein